VFFIITNTNYQAFIENKNLITIKELKLEIESYEEQDNKINGLLCLNGVGYLNTLDELSEFQEKLSFSIDKNNDIDCDIDSIEIDNFVYQIVEGRGLELELDFIVNYKLKERTIVKEEIAESIDEKLSEVFSISEVKVEEKVVNRDSLKSRRSYRYTNLEVNSLDDNGKIIIKRNK